MKIEQKLDELGIELPDIPPLAGMYERVKRVGNLLFVSGQGPTLRGEALVSGKVGDTRTIEDGQYAAKLCTINALSVLKDYLGDLDRIKSFVKILGFVASANGFAQQPKVVDGASLFLKEVFGDTGVAARSAIGSNQLPNDITVEIEYIVEIKE
ncbi:MAG: RidA family protein [Sphaerochaetaceae bacterium]|nr:RidA family protein [Sphaerochaetaceae bacterium]